MLDIFYATPEDFLWVYKDQDIFNLCFFIIVQIIHNLSAVTFYIGS